MKTSAAGIAFICAHEGNGLRGKPFQAYQDGGGVWTIGYGHTASRGHPKPVAGMKITETQARDILASDLAWFEAEVSKLLKRSPNQNQFDALVSLTYNIGAGAFAKSTVLRRFNAGDIAGAGAAFMMWVKDGNKTVQGLVTRRSEERALFLRSVPPIIPETPQIPDMPEPLPLTSAPSIQTVMVGVIGIIIAGIAALFKFGG